MKSLSSSLIMLFFRFFIAISYDQTALEIYDFKGSAAANDLIHDIKGEVTPCPEHTSELSAHVRGKVFSCFLAKRHVVHVVSGDEVLNRECSLFTDNSRFVIVGSSHQLHDDQFTRFYDVYRNNECITPNYRLMPEDYTLSIVELKTGRTYFYPFHCKCV